MSHTPAHPIATPRQPALQAPPAGHRRRSLLAAVPLAIALCSALLVGMPQGASAGGAATFDSAFVQFQQALDGQSSAIDGAARQWRELSDAAPADPVLRAYAGAATAMLATTTLLPWRKMTHAEDGLALIDKALAQITPAHDAPAHQGVPASLETRFVAASTFLGLPAMFNRNERGAKLLGEVVRSPLLEASPASFRASVWMAAGNEAAKAKRADEARQWWQKVAASGAPQADKALARLKAL
jgi:hypothetical protein